MATLTAGTSWGGNIILTKRTGTTLTLPTAEEYVDRDIQFTLGAQSGAAAGDSAAANADVESTTGTGGTNISGVIGQKTSTEPSSGYYIRVKATGSGNSKVTSAGWLDTGSLASASAEQTVFFPIDVGTATVTGSNTVTPSASISGSNVTLSNVDNGVSVNAVGGGSASATANASGVNAGYVPANTPIGTATLDASSTTTSVSSFISGVTIPKPSSGTNTFSVTLPNGGDDTITLTFIVDENGNFTIE